MHVVITGTSRGIGLELCRQALEAGDHVLAVARKPHESHGLSELQIKFPKTLQTADADLTEGKALDKIEAAIHLWPGVDVLINNAGVYCKGDHLKDFMASFHINSVVPFQVTSALLPYLRKGHAPRVIQITSLMGSMGENSSGGSYAYRASKAALNMINKCLAVENEWLILSVVHPGWVKTEMGGSGAPVEIEGSAGGIWTLARNLTKKDSGGFFDFRGRSLPW